MQASSIRTRLYQDQTCRKSHRCPQVVPAVPIAQAVEMRLAFASLLCLAAFGQDRHVVVISLDGYPAYALRDPQTPATTLRRLIREGTWAPDGMLPVNPTVTWPNHTAMVTGVDASRHEVIYN